VPAAIPALRGLPQAASFDAVVEVIAVSPAPTFPQFPYGIDARSGRRRSGGMRPRSA
jgi:hypothetical protein